MLARLLGFGHPEERMQATAWGSWFGEGTTTYAGVTVNAETSVQLLAVYGSVRLIAVSRPWAR